ncbi:Exosome complex exonuclease [Colletotrichum fructicola]|uniref:Exosome complex exonuclease rrp6 n=1 Tax=Colletotrichum fructicola (strain Nara gc5) TaxID=1213859 RepID=A0A7J6J3N0_COLFN|nr:Exosome complex exonuclease [Colletotrichum fructicola]KAE9582503.1 Exosome complex exonuclease [Colletotrichum fructicola]KAF4434256.1 Exosome complex exonuclease rrp6 [Colletotrichum fructicola]KAF4484441.1 Exosome complex exonuclease rrp6 [Colletotrichum fructicola Nara gc5]
MTSPQDFKSLQEKVQSALVATTRSVNRIAAEDLAFQRAVNPGVGDDLDAKTERLLELSTTLLKSAASVCGLNAPNLEDADDIDMRWRSVVDVVDSVLEKADTSIDEYTGAIKRKDAPTADASQAKKAKTTGTDKVIRNANISKPQLNFDPPVDNNATWKPILTEKPHAKVPLEQSLVSNETDGFVTYKHPYEAEILEAKYPDRVYQQAEPIPWQPVDKTEATWVDTFEGVLEMLEELKKAKEIAVDLEHHDFRTYVGLTSLMQISTREKDWVVDTLKPWRQQLQVLNQVFADPNIVKVFHGSYMDIIWLQRDLGLYVNGLFDTFYACEALHYPQKSLAFLLSKFANFDADKRYQMADWRMRPLSPEMLYYARSDTHYLLYVYDKVRNELVMKSDRGNPGTNYIETVLQKSKSQSLSRYEGEHFDPVSGKGPKGWYGLLLKHPAPFSGQQFAVYRAVWAWRDEVARREDESTAYVLPNAIIGDIAKRMPPDAKALHALIPPSSHIARRNVSDIWVRYQEARERGVEEPSLYHFFRSDLPSRPAKPLVETAVDDAADVAAEPGQLAQSQLFGGMALSSAWEATPSAANGLGDFVMLPWQKFVQNVATTEATAQEDVAMEGGVEAEAKAAAQPEAPPVEEEFTLKAGTKRRAPAQEESDGSDDESGSEESTVDIVLERADGTPSGKRGKTTEGDRKAKVEQKRADKVARYTEDYQRAQAEVERLTKDLAEDRAYPVQLEEAQGIASEKKQKLDNYVTALANRKAKAEKKAAAKARKQEKAERKKQKEAEKLAKKAAKKAAKSKSEGEGDDDEEEEAFDYGQAASVLHAKRNGGGVKKVAKPAFDPYAKTGDDAPKGARKAPPPRGEKSATFKR